MMYLKQKATIVGNIIIATAFSSMISSCGNAPSAPGSEPAVSSSGTTLIGAGATFPYPLYSKMFSAYHKETGKRVNYQSVGSGAGIQQLHNRIVDFGASDAPMTDEELSSAPAEIVHIPTTLGSVVITYNLPGSPKLKLSAEVLSEVFLGNIKMWNDPLVVRLNPDVSLPSLPITVVHRSDGSGTTYIFSEYLVKVSEVWNSRVGMGKSLNWPVGLGAKGNEGVSGFVKQTPGSIGYVELAYAFQNKMSMAFLQNQSGNFIAPTLASTSAAANVGDLPDDLRVSITNTSAPDGYPICSFSYVLLFKDQAYKSRSVAQATNTVELIAWMLSEGQQFSEALLYGKLPANVVVQASDKLKTIHYKGESLIQ